MKGNNKIKIHKIPELKKPCLIATWPGMGYIAIRAGEYLKEKLNVEIFAEIITKYFFSPTDIVITDNEIQLPSYPVGKFFYCNTKTENDVIIFICSAQPELNKEYEYAKLIIDFAIKLNVKRIYTFAAMPIAIEHTQQSGVWGAVTNKSLILDLEMHNVKAMDTGRISGLNGLLLGVAKECGIEGVCLLGELPFYTVQLENPKSSLAILEVLSKMINLKIDLTDLEIESNNMQKRVEAFFEYFDISKLQQIISPQHQDTKTNEMIQKIITTQKKLDPKIKDKIENLFNEVKKDISKAKELKQELDKLGIYKEFEDRFLDLFRRKDKKDQH